MIQNCHLKSVNVSQKNKRRKKRRLKKRKKTRTKFRSIIKGEVLKVEEIPKPKLKETVINLLDKIANLTPHQLYLFYLGESLAPIPLLPDYFQFRLGILQFAYRLRWGWYTGVKILSEPTHLILHLLLLSLLNRNWQ